MAELTFPPLPHWVGTEQSDNPPSGRTLDDATGYFLQSIERTPETWVTEAGPVTLTAKSFGRRHLYLNAGNSVWTLPKGLNLPLNLGVDKDGLPITFEASMMLEIWQLGNGYVTLSLDSSMTLYKESGLANIRTNGVNTLLTVIYHPNSRNSLQVKAG